MKSLLLLLRVKNLTVKLNRAITFKFTSQHAGVYKKHARTDDIYTYVGTPSHSYIKEVKRNYYKVYDIIFGTADVLTSRSNFSRTLYGNTLSFLRL